MAENEQGAPEQAASPKRPGLLENKLFVVFMIVALQGGMAFATSRFLLKPATDPMATEAEAGGDAEAAVDTRPRGTLVSLEEMVVSLSAPGRPRYLRTTIALEAGNAKAAALIEERMAEFRDAAIMRLSSHGPEDLGSYEGKEAVKAEIKESLKLLLAEGEILNVYYSDFVVQ